MRHFDCHAGGNRWLCEPEPCRTIRTIDADRHHRRSARANGLKPDVGSLVVEGEKPATVDDETELRR